MTSVRKAVLDELAAAIPLARGTDCVMVGIDGPDAAGKTTLADDLAELVRASGRRVVRVSVDDFHNPPATRYRRGRDSAEGFWLDAFDYDRLRRHLVEHPTEPGSVVVVDGLFLQREELRGWWHVVVYLHVSAECSVQRMIARDGAVPEKLRRYVAAQQLYLAACDPVNRADVVIDNTDPRAPRVVRSR